jgi:azurin/glucose/arabinose dehydrogenase/lysophospholipase L1-like esterase
MSHRQTRTGRLLKAVATSCLALAGATWVGYAWHSTPADAADVQQQGPAGPLKLSKADHIAILGGALADRMQFEGTFEAEVVTKYPAEELVFRNLSAAGDEVSTWHRSENFGTRDEWLAKTKADVILAFYGYNESFKGDAGLPQFKADLDRFIKETRQKNYSGKGAPRLVLFSPTAAERNKDPNLPDPRPVNANLSKYVAAMAEVAKADGVQFVDLFNPSQRLFEEAAKAGNSLTADGVHLTNEAYEQLAPEMFREVFGESAPEVSDKLRTAINDKNWLWHTRYRTMDGYNVYGGRSGLAYQPDNGAFLQGQRNPPSPYISNFQVMQEEMSQRDVMTANRDKVVWAAASGKELQPDDSDLPPVQKVPTNHPGDKPDKSWTFFSGEEAIAKMKVPAHCKVNLFADEKMFPELIKPVQMAWDQRGRLWVSAWRNYPERTPTSTIGDSILILEDTDGDGKADKCTHYIDDLNCPTGFQFYKDGILLMQAPDLWFVRDTTGGDHANSRERVLMGLDSADSHHTTNSMVLEPGGATYLSDGVFHRTQVETNAGPVRNVDAAVYRYEPRSGRFETYVSYSFANPHGRVFDYWGNDIITDATGNASYFAPAFSGHIDYPAKHPGMNQFWNRPSRPCPGTGIMTSKHFPEEFWNNFLNCNVISFQGIYRVKMQEEGSGILGTTIPEELVSSSDPNFRPSQVAVGPDGAVYFADWSNDIIGHMQHHLRDPNRDHVHGRIYRMTYEGRPLNPKPQIAGQPVAKLLDFLKDPQDQVRLWAKLELGRHESGEVIPAFKQWAQSLDKNDPAYEHHMLEALWMHQWFNVVDEDLLHRMLQSPEPRARAQAVRVLCCWRDRVADPLPLLKKAAEDQHPRVRLEAVRAASFFRDAAAADVALAALKQPVDYYIDYCLKETMKQLQPYWRQSILDGKPIAADNPAGLNFIVGNLDTAELLKMPRTPAVEEMILVRAGVPDVTRQEVLVALAQERKASPAAVLLDRIEALKANRESSAAMARLLPQQPAAELAKLRDRLMALATNGSTPDLRQPAWAAVAAADASFDKVWAQGGQSPEKLVDVLAAIPLVFDQDLRATTYERVKPFLSPQLPLDVTNVLRALPTVNGRFVRIELPKRGILGLAEVQVFSGSHNVALAGKAHQSSTAKGGDANKAIDGKTDGDGAAQSISQTSGKDKGWWEVDLGEEHPIDAITIWNRTDDKNSRRLDGYSLIVLDAHHKEIWRRDNNPVPQETARFEVGPDGVGTLRRAAIHAAASIPANQADTFVLLLGLIERGDQVPAVARGIRVLPPKTWPKGPAGQAAKALVAWAKNAPTSERTSEDYVAAIQLAGDLAGQLPPAEAQSLRAELKQLRVAVFVLNSVREQMRYDSPRLVVEAGKPFEIIFNNTDFMPHNIVIITPGSRPKVGAASATMKPDELDRAGRPYIPQVPEVLAATKLIEPAQRATMTFTAPPREGDYEYVCTFPGHWESMWGTLVVTKDVDAYMQSHPNVTAAPPPKPQASAGHEHHHTQ